MKNSQSGTMWITDGTVNKKIKITDEVPSGWSKGRKNVHDSEMRARIAELSKNNNPEKRKKTMISKYGSLTTESRLNAIRNYHETVREEKNQLPFEKKSQYFKRLQIEKEQNNKCLHCGLDNWLSNPIKLELDHIDGNNKNNARNNLRLLCPNCHSFTETWRKKKGN
jgi:5-methylcytosine-specific restriction endonuclease McrA